MDQTSAILERLMALFPRGIDLSLDRVRELLADMGSPHLNLPPVIHIAGTNGKGSTTAFLRSMLEAAGKTVHVYSSPHLVRFHERIRLGAPGGSRLVADEPLMEALLEAERVNAGRPVTQFEITTAAAFKLFAENPADYTLLEVGLGGRLDATNVVPDPVATVITPISMDHEAYLGTTLAAIAGEKAGIIKDRRPVVVSAQPGDALAVIEREAARRRAPLSVAGQDWSAYAEHGRLVYQDEGGLLDLPPPKLVGRHQYGNAGTAIATLRTAGIAMAPGAIETGLATVDWPARMQRLTSGRLVNRTGPAIGELWLDGGHNPGAGVVIGEAMAELEDRAPRPLYLIVGMILTKDPVGFLKPFAGLARGMVAIPVPDHPAYTPAQLVEAAGAAGIDAATADSVEAALDLIVAAGLPDVPPRVLICGSLYLAGHVLDANGTPPQ